MLMSDFDKLFQEKSIKFNNGATWKQPSKDRGWIKDSEISTNSANKSLFQFFDTNKNNRLDAKELNSLFNSLYNFAESDGNSELNIHEIEQFLSFTKENDNGILKDAGLKAKDIESFLMQINTITEEKTKEVPKDSNTARQREDTLEQYVSRYNLLHDKTTDSDLLRLAQSVVSEYLDEYGVLSNSTSRSISILHTTLSEDENKAYDMLRLRPEKLSDDPEIAKKQKEAIIKKYNFANCGEAADITSSILQKLNSEKYEVSKIYFDPLILPVCVEQTQAVEALNTIKMIKESFDPPVKTVIGLSNISNGSPADLRPLINRVFMVLAAGCGIDSAIIDSFDEELLRINSVIETQTAQKPYDNAYLSLFEIMQNFEELDAVKYDANDPQQVKIIKTAQILLNHKVYTNSYLEI